MHSLKIVAFLVLTSLSLTGCVIGGNGWQMSYKMQAVNIPSDIKTAGVAQFQNKAALIQPMLAQDLTDKLKDKILSQSRLKIVSGLNGDVNFECFVSDYSTQPVAPQANATAMAALNRLTVKIQVKYTNSKDQKAAYEQEFSRYMDFDAAKNLTDIEQGDEYKKMLDELIVDMFNRAFVSW